jgi:hypothetical protein
MPDVESQLRQYFDSTVERIDADDVITGARITSHVERWDVRSRRRLLAFTAAAFGVAASISLVVVGAMMLSGGQRIGEATAPRAATPAGSIAWPLALAVVGAAIAAIAVLAITRIRRKGGFMETLERQTPEIQIEHLRQSNRGLIIALVVALLALAGLGTWLLFDKVLDTGVEAEINALLDEFFANANSGDFEANSDFYANSGVYIEGRGDVYQADDIPDRQADLERNIGEFSYEQLGDPSIIQDPDTNRYYVAVPGQIGIGVDPYYKHFLTFVFSKTTDGDLQIISQMVSPHDGYR